MNQFLPTVIWRHRKENLNKCSLRGLETRSDFIFYTYPREPLPSLENYILLDLAAPPLSQEDQEKGLFLIDGTWAYAEKMTKRLDLPLIKRSLPSHLVTAYPRKQTHCLDPKRGLASIEALFAAYTILGRSTSGLLDHFHWKEIFLQKNNFSIDLGRKEEHDNLVSDSFQSERG